jgi:tetratricopeptide (TPR) repeat protein
MRARAWLRLRQGQWHAAAGRQQAAREALQQALADAKEPLPRAEAWLALAEVAPQAVDLAALQQEVAGMAAWPASHYAALQAQVQEALGLAAQAQGRASLAQAAFAAASTLRDGLLPDSLWRQRAAPRPPR